MSFLYWVLLLSTIAGAGWLAYQYRIQVEKSRKLRLSLRDTAKRLDNPTVEHEEKAARHEENEAKLRTDLQLMDTVINTIPTPIYFKDEDGIFHGCNKVFSKLILGLTRDRIIGKRPQDLPEQIPPDLAATYQREEMKLEDKDGHHTFEAQVQCEDGERRDFLFSLAALEDAEGQPSGTVAVLSDLTEKNRAAQVQIQKEKLEGVLETAGAACHEFNQPLQALSGYMEIMEIKLKGREAADYIEKINAQIERMRDISDKLHGVTRYETTEYAGNTRIIDIHRSS